MKKINGKELAAAAVVLAAVAVLTGCGAVQEKIKEKVQDTVGSTVQSAVNGALESASKAVEAAGVDTTRAGAESETSADEHGYFEGRLGDTMATTWFDFSVIDAYLTDAYESYTASTGSKLLVVKLYVKNTFNESIPMSAYDFQIQWGDDENDEAYGYPLAAEQTSVGKDELPEEYTLKINESVIGYAVYEVPEGTGDYSISYVEYYDDGTEGDMYFVYFSAVEE